jgi:hypothetical protein
MESEDQQVVRCPNLRHNLVVGPARLVDRIETCIGDRAITEKLTLQRLNDRPAAWLDGASARSRSLVHTVLAAVWR